MYNSVVFLVFGIPFWALFLVQVGLSGWGLWLIAVSTWVLFWGTVWMGRVRFDFKHPELENFDDNGEPLNMDGVDYLVGNGADFLEHMKKKKDDKILGKTRKRDDNN